MILRVDLDRDTARALLEHLMDTDVPEGSYLVIETYLHPSASRLPDVRVSVTDRAVMKPGKSFPGAQR